MKNDEEAFFKKIFDYCNFEPPRDWQSRIHIGNQPVGRMNKGVTGRGKSLTDKQRDRIVALTRYYTEIDFSRMGIVA
jgi:hypothetical protein